MAHRQNGTTVLGLNGNNHALAPEPPLDSLPGTASTLHEAESESASAEGLQHSAAVLVETASGDESRVSADGGIEEDTVLQTAPLEFPEEAERIPAPPAGTAGWLPLLASGADLKYAAEQYRIVRTKLVQKLGERFRVVVTSPGIGDGKTVNAINLAASLAMKSEGRTLLIDADLRRANVHRWLDLPPSPGLADVLSGACPAQDAIVPVEGLPGLLVMPAGHARENPTELLDSSRWRSLAALLQEKFPQVILDCPPVEVVADYDLIAAVCEGVVLVVRPDHTDRANCLAALAKLRPKLTGVLINESREWFLWKKGSHGSYYYARKHEKSTPKA
jgi:protein-tyrosine kinase